MRGMEAETVNDERSRRTFLTTVTKAFTVKEACSRRNNRRSYVGIGWQGYMEEVGTAKYDFLIFSAKEVVLFSGKSVRKYGKEQLDPHLRPRSQTRRPL